MPQNAGDEATEEELEELRRQYPSPAQGGRRGERPGRFDDDHRPKRGQGGSARNQGGQKRPSRHYQSEESKDGQGFQETGKQGEPEPDKGERFHASSTVVFMPNVGGKIMSTPTQGPRQDARNTRSQSPFQMSTAKEPCPICGGEKSETSRDTRNNHIGQVFTCYPCKKRWQEEQDQAAALIIADPLNAEDPIDFPAWVLKKVDTLLPDLRERYAPLEEANRSIQEIWTLRHYLDDKGDLLDERRSIALSIRSKVLGDNGFLDATGRLPQALATLEHRIKAIDRLLPHIQRAAAVRPKATTPEEAPPPADGEQHTTDDGQHDVSPPVVEEGTGTLQPAAAEGEHAPADGETPEPAAAPARRLTRKERDAVEAAKATTN